jgi:hypothetical protein
MYFNWLCDGSQVITQFHSKTWQTENAACDPQRSYFASCYDLSCKKIYISAADKNKLSSERTSLQTAMNHPHGR